MKTQNAHAHEDRLLDFAYDELPQPEARQVELHVQGCSRCAETLQGIRGVRNNMSRLVVEPAPDAGLDSLLAYAQQSARRAAAGPAPAPRWWRRMLAPALGMAAMSLLGVMVVQVNRQVDLSPSLQQKTAPEPTVRGAPTPAGAVAPASPAPPPMPVLAEAAKDGAPKEEESRQRQVLAPAAKKPAPSKVGSGVKSDWSNAGAGSAGGFPPKIAARDEQGDSEAYGDSRAQEAELPSPAKTKGAGPARSLAYSTSAPTSVPGYAGNQGRMEQKASPSPAEPEADIPQQVAQNAPPKWARADRAASVYRGSSTNEADDADAPAPTGSAPRANASPPPFPAAASPATQVADLSRAEEQSSRKAERSPTADKKEPETRPLTIGEVLGQASVARRSGNWREEMTFLRAALTSGVRGSQRVDVLSRLCELESTQGDAGSAIAFCKQVVALAPGSSQAQGAMRVLGELQSPADAAAAEKSASPVSQ